MENDLIYKLFIRFLKDNGVFNAFKDNFTKQAQVRKSWACGSTENFINHERVGSMKGYFSNIKQKSWLLSWAFSWAETKEGHSFWEKLSNQWRIKLEGFKKI